MERVCDALADPLADSVSEKLFEIVGGAVRVEERDRDEDWDGGTVNMSCSRGRRVEGVKGRQSQKLMLFGLPGKPVKYTNVQ